MAPDDALQPRLNRLTVSLPRLVRELPDPADFWPVFAGEADAIQEDAGPEHDEWVARQIEAMLVRHGLRH